MSSRHARGPSCSTSRTYRQHPARSLQRNVVAQTQLKERASSPVRTESTLPELNSLNEATLRFTEEDRRALEDSYAKLAYESTARRQREWGSWTGNVHASSPFQSTDSTTAQHDNGRLGACSTAVLASADTHSDAPPYSAGLMQPHASGHAVRQSDPHGHGLSHSSSLQGRIKCSIDENVTQRMSEAEAWDVVTLWRRVVDCCVEGSTTQLGYAMEVQMLDVHSLPSSQRKQLPSQCGIPWTMITELQQLKNVAELSLMNHHTGLLTKIVKRLQSEPALYSQNQADMHVEGMTQLRACIWSFNTSLGTSFSTYLWSQLHTRIRHALEGKDSAVHVPRGELELRRRVYAAKTATLRAQHEGSNEAEHSENLQTVATSSGATVAEVSRTLAGAHIVEFSPDSVVADSNSGWDILAQQQTTSDAETDTSSIDSENSSYVDMQQLSWTLELPHLLEMVNDVVDGMSEKQAQVLILAYGLKGESKLTLKEIAKRCGMKSHNLVKYHLKKAQQMLMDGLSTKHDLQPADILVR